MLDGLSNFFEINGVNFAARVTVLPFHWHQEKVGPYGSLHRRSAPNFSPRRQYVCRPRPRPLAVQVTEARQLLGPHTGQSRERCDRQGIRAHHDWSTVDVGTLVRK